VSPAAPAGRRRLHLRHSRPGLRQRLLLNEGILAVPGSGFDRPGYMRLTLTVPRDTIERSLPALARAFLAAPVVSLPQ
jgi:aspartate/methionine/tyrosine aminotransferase